VVVVAEMVMVPLFAQVLTVLLTWSIVTEALAVIQKNTVKKNARGIFFLIKQKMDYYLKRKLPQYMPEAFYINEKPRLIDNCL